MKCNQCSTENAESSKFCVNCGNQLQPQKKIVVCSQCNRENNEGLNFCEGCGSSLNHTIKNEGSEGAIQQTPPEQNQTGMKESSNKVDLKKPTTPPIQSNAAVSHTPETENTNQQRVVIPAVLPIQSNMTGAGTVNQRKAKKIFVFLGLAVVVVVVLGFFTTQKESTDSMQTSLKEETSVEEKEEISIKTEISEEESTESVTTESVTTESVKLEPIINISEEEALLEVARRFYGNPFALGGMLNVSSDELVELDGYDDLFYAFDIFYYRYYDVIVYLNSNTGEVLFELLESESTNPLGGKITAYADYATTLGPYGHPNGRVTHFDIEGWHWMFADNLPHSVELVDLMTTLSYQRGHVAGYGDSIIFEAENTSNGAFFYVGMVLDTWEIIWVDKIGNFSYEEMWIGHTMDQLSYAGKSVNDIIDMNEDRRNAKYTLEQKLLEMDFEDYIEGLPYVRTIDDIFYDDFGNTYYGFYMYLYRTWLVAVYVNVNNYEDLIIEGFYETGGVAYSHNNIDLWFNEYVRSW